MQIIAYKMEVTGMLVWFFFFSQRKKKIKSDALIKISAISWNATAQVRSHNRNSLSSAVTVQTVQKSER